MKCEGPLNASQVTPEPCLQFLGLGTGSVARIFTLCRDYDISVAVEPSVVPDGSVRLSK